MKTALFSHPSVFQGPNSWERAMKGYVENLKEIFSIIFKDELDCREAPLIHCICVNFWRSEIQKQLKKYVFMRFDQILHLSSFQKWWLFLSNSFLLTKWASIVSFQPFHHTAKVKRVLTICHYRNFSRIFWRVIER